MLVSDIRLAALLLSLAFFFAELIVAPIWAVTMDIVPRHPGLASGIMNFGSAFAGIVSPLCFGIVVDLTGSWTIPFSVSVALLVLGAALTFRFTRARNGHRAASGAGGDEFRSGWGAA